MRINRLTALAVGVLSAVLALGPQAAQAAPDAPATSEAPATQEAPEPSDAPAKPAPVENADVSVVLSTGEKQIAAGESFEYNLAIKNNGPAAATAVRAIVAMSLELELQSSEPRGCVQQGQTVACPAINSLASGKTVSYKLKTKLNQAFVDNGGDIGAVARIGSDTPDPDENNDISDLVGLPGGSPAPPKSDVELKVGPSEKGALIIAVHNKGPSPTASGFAKIDFGPHMSAAEVPEGCASLSEGRRVNCTLPAGLAAGADGQVSIGVNIEADVKPGEEVTGGKVTIVIPGDTSDDNTKPITGYRGAEPDQGAAKCGIFLSIFCWAWNTVENFAEGFVINALQAGSWAINITADAGQWAWNTISTIPDAFTGDITPGKRLFDIVDDSEDMGKSIVDNVTDNWDKSGG